MKSLFKQPDIKRELMRDDAEKYREDEEQSLLLEYLRIYLRWFCSGYE